MKQQTIVLLFLILVKMVIHYFLVDPSYDLHRDAYLHLDQGKHLAWGFESVPPFTSWLSLLVAGLGNNVFWIKFFPALFGALTMVVVWNTIDALGGNLFAKVLGAVAILFSAILRINILYQPNSFDILCWTFLYFSFLRYIQSNERKWLMFAAVCFAIAFLNKYSIVFLLCGLLPALLISRHRIVFSRPPLYWSMLVAIIIISPNLLWQYENGFPVVHHMKALTDTQLVNVKRGDFLKEQVLFFFGSLFILLASFIAFIFYKPFRMYRIFAWAFLFSLLVFTYFKAKGYYAIGLYPFLIAFGSVYLEDLTSHGWKRWLRPLMVTVIIVLFIPFFKIAFPVLRPEAIVKDNKTLRDLGLLRWEDGKDHALPQDFADMVGWSELAGKVDNVYKTLNDAGHTLVLCDNYGQAGAINYYSAFDKIGAVSMNADYINWFPLKTKQVKHVILIKDENDNDTLRTREHLFFNKVALMGSIENSYAREVGTKIYLLTEATTNINKILQEEISDRKNK